MADEATPLLIISDAPAGATGLGRITRELALRIHADLPQFRVGTLGIGGTVSRQLPFQQYPVMRIDSNMVIHDLPEVMKDFCEGSTARPIVMTILNPSWTPWIANPAFSLPAGPLREYLRSGTRPFDLWGYIPIDGHTPSGKLPQDSVAALRGFDRLLAYTNYGSEVIGRALASPGKDVSLFKQPKRTPHLPHGLDTSIFFPRDRTIARRTFLEHIQDKPVPPEHNVVISDDMVLISAVATNSARKDWHLAFEVCGELLKRGVNVFFWGHTDAISKHWNLGTLATEYNMTQRTVVSCTSISNEAMAWAYSACDCCLSIGSGEGFGYTSFEPLACGVPVIHSDYSGSAEYLLPPYKVAPIAYQVEAGPLILRPIADGAKWADAVQAVLGQPAVLPEELDWVNLWPHWKSWLTEGIK